MKKITKAVIPIGGFGTRFLPITKSIPKEMLPIVDKPVIQYILEELVSSGIKEVYMVISKDKEAIIDYFSRNKRLEKKLVNNKNENRYKEILELSSFVKIKFIMEKEQSGCAKAIYKAKKYLKNDEAFAIILGDDLIRNDESPALKQLIDIYENTNTSVVGVHEVPLKEVEKYGILDTLDKSNVKKVVEKPSILNAPSNLAILGRYVVSYDFFDKINKINRGVGGEYQISDVLNLMIEDKGLKYKIVKGTYYDIGSKEGYINATMDYAKTNENLDSDKLNFS